jgi:hypothetical protein
MDVIELIGKGFWNAFQMAWEVWWALILGFLLSGVVQAWIPRERMEHALGGRGVRTLLLSTGLGAASSSCSYAAVAIAKSMFQKGASLAAAMAFQFASTNLVFEIGIVLWIFLGCSSPWPSSSAASSSSCSCGSRSATSSHGVSRRRHVSTRSQQRPAINITWPAPKVSPGASG